MLAAPRTSSRKLKLLKILIVDDDERIRQMIKAIIADTAIIICECSDGAQAVDCYAQHQPDWVLMDIMMPRMDGISATHLIMADHPSARIIIVTSHDSPALREEARGAGACGFVPKESLLELNDILHKPGAPTWL
jgi:CheY-like chemotaxis protein